jgi:hypothetical protein
MAATVIDALRRFLPDHLRERQHAMTQAQRRAAWAIAHCRTAEMGGHLHACDSCDKKEFHFHSCNHRSCPQCGKDATAQWVQRELGKRVGAPYFMVTFTLPEELRPLFFCKRAKEIYQLLLKNISRVRHRLYTRRELKSIPLFGKRTGEWISNPLEVVRTSSNT